MDIILPHEVTLFSTQCSKYPENKVILHQFGSSAWENFLGRSFFTVLPIYRTPAWKEGRKEGRKEENGVVNYLRSDFPSNKNILDIRSVGPSRSLARTEEDFVIKLSDATRMNRALLSVQRRCLTQIVQISPKRLVLEVA